MRACRTRGVPVRYNCAMGWRGAVRDGRRPTSGEFEYMERFISEASDREFDDAEADVVTAYELAGARPHAPSLDGFIRRVMTPVEAARRDVRRALMARGLPWDCNA